MDLGTSARLIQLDALLVSASTALRRAGVPHLLLKGPSTARWLYDPPRAYRDVDLLVPASRIEQAADVLVAAGVARRTSGLGEEAAHSLVMVSPHGLELDLHVSLGGLPPRYGSGSGDALWDVLAEHVEPLTVDGVDVPSLDLPGRCVVVALHAAGSGSDAEQVHEDLRRALQAVDAAGWARARALARELHAEAEFDAGRGGDDPAADRPVAAYLNRSGAPAAAHGLHRVASAPARRRPGMLWHELVPSRAFMQRLEPGPPVGGRALAGRYVRRWVGLARQLPGAVTALRDARRQGGRRP